MTTYRLVARRFRLVTARDEKGTPLSWEYVERGGLLTDLDEKEVRRLLKASAIVPADEDTDQDELPFTEPEAPSTEPEEPTEPTAPVDPTNPFADADDSGTTPVEEFKRPANSAALDKWRVFAIAKVKSQYAEEGLEAPEEILEEIDAADRAFLIRTYGSKD